MEAIRELLNVGTGIENLTVGTILLAVVCVTVGFGLGGFSEGILSRIKARVPEETIRWAILDAFTKPTGWLLRVAGLWTALRVLPFGTEAGHHVMLALTVVFATWLGTRIINNLTDIWREHVSQTEGTYDDQLVPIVRSVSKVALLAVGIVMVVQNLGFDVSSLLAGLGIGGAALAFASKDTVANFFGSLIIFVDRPFQVGDWIEIKDVEGTVEEVGLRVTRIRTFANSLISIPNAAFTTDAINNWSRMQKRRVKLIVGLTYDTSPDKMRQAVAAIRNIIKSDDRLHQDFYLVNFYDFGTSSLDIFCYLFTRTTNWAEHMQIREEFLLRVMEAIRGLGLSFAFPTTTVHLAGDGSRPDRGGRAMKTPEPPGAPKSMSRDLPL